MAGDRTAQKHAAIRGGEGIRYWEVIPKVFDYPNDQDISPCPFRYSGYQWMRNPTNCYAIAKESNLKPAFTVIYADHPALPFSQKVKSGDWPEFIGHVRTNNICMKTLSYQELIRMAGEIDQSPGAPWSELIAWVDRKIEAARMDRKIK